MAGDGLRYLSTIVWTALSYNPVRVLGGIGLAGVGVALVVALGLVVARLSGTEALGPGGVVGVFAALVVGVGGVSLFGLGATFNYLVALLRRRPIRYGLFGTPLFATPLERHFAGVGLGSLVAGVVTSAASSCWLCGLADRSAVAVPVGQRAPDSRRPPAGALVAHHVGARRRSGRTVGREA